MYSRILALLLMIVGAGLLYGCSEQETVAGRKDEKKSQSTNTTQTDRSHTKTSRTEESTMPENQPSSASDSLIAVFQTDKGEIRIKLFADKTPLTVANFVNLAQRKYYDGLTFHRVIANFMIQGGCPLGNGTGDPGYRFEDECRSDLRHDKPGILSMANAGPATNGSQFFITHVPTPHLNGKHTVFGEVVDTSDQETVNRVVRGDKIQSVSD